MTQNPLSPSRLAVLSRVILFGIAMTSSTVIFLGIFVLLQIRGAEVAPDLDHRTAIEIMIRQGIGTATLIFILSMMVRHHIPAPGANGTSRKSGLFSSDRGRDSHFDGDGDGD